MTEYETIKLREGQSAWDPVQPSKMNAAHVFDCRANGKQIRRITRDGNVCTIEHIESGRKVEFPWTNVRHAVPMAVQSQPKVERGGR